MKIKNLLSLIALLYVTSIAAQTTYTWIGGNGAWNVANNWSPTRTTPAATDILQFNDGGTHTVTAVQTQTIRQLLITNNTNVTLNGAAAGNTLTITGLTGNTNFLIEAGSALDNRGSGNYVQITLTNVSGGQLAEISGTLDWKGNGVTATGTLNLQTSGANVTTVTSTGVINHHSGTITGASNRLVFEQDAIYNYLGTSTALTVPTASWDANSQVNITGVTSGIPGGLNQNFGKILWDCVAQSAAINLATFPISVTSFEVRNTNNQIVANNFGTRNWTTNGGGDLLITGGRFAVRGTLTSLVTLTVNNVIIENILNPNAQLTINNGTSTTTNAVTLNVAGNLSVNLAQNATHTNVVEYRGVTNITEVINLSGNFTQTGTNSGRIGRTNSVGTHNFVFSNGNTTYSAARDDIFGTLTTINVTGSTVNFGNHTLNYTGNFALTNAAAHAIFGASAVLNNTGTFTTWSSVGSTLSIGSQDGITTTGASGNIQSTGTRTFHANSNYIFIGTNGQITGNGCPANVTGSLTLNLQNFSDQLIVTNTNAIGAAGTIRIISGSLANAITYNATGRLEYAGIQAQTTTNNEFPATSGPAGLIINNPFGVTLHASRSLPATTAGVLTLTSGVLNTTSTEILSVLQAVVGAVVGGDASSYVNGPLIRAINAAGNYRFPVGDGSQYGGYYMTTAAAASGVQLRVQHVNSASGGTAGSGLASIQPYYWSVERTAGTTAVNYTAELEIAGLATDSRVGYAPTQIGAYSNQGGLNIAASVTATAQNSINNTTPNAFYTVGTSVPFSGIVTVGTSGMFTSLTNDGGLFQAINNNVLNGNLIAEITSDLTAELGTHALNQWTEIGAGNYTVTIRPDGNTNRLISGNYNGANSLLAGLIRFNGADRVIVDGRNPSDLAANGRHLLFRNISTTNSTNNSTLNLLNDADNITIRNIQAEGATTGSGNGVIRVSSDGSGDGNDFVTITECIVRDRSDAAGIPANGIYIVGAFGRENNNYTITNNEVFNYHMSVTTQHAGIYTGAYCTDFTISGNSIYDPTTRNTASYKMGIWVNSSTGTGANFDISNNFIGGNSVGANGTWTVTSSGLDYRFCGIWISCSNTGNSVVSNNTIRNFSITTGSAFQTQSSVFSGIYVAAGDPTISDNSIGGNTGNITITNSSGQFTWVTGIFYNSNGGVNISDNTVGGYAISNTTSNANIMNMAGIRASTSSSSAMLISGNTVGGENSPMTNSSGNTYNTITAISISGILAESAQPTTIENNTVSHISYTANGQSTSGAFQVAGIRRVSAAAVNTITGNTVHNISSNSPYSGSGANVGLAGIYAGGTSNGQDFSENTIHTIRNTNAGAVAVRVYGMFYNGNIGANNSITRNSIHSIFANSSATTAELAGLYVNAGNALVANNMVRIGIDENGDDITRGHSFNGIHDQAGANNYYHNSVYVGGNGVASGAIASHAFFSAVSTGNRAIQNNIFWNGRSNGAATGSHYAIRIGALTNLTISHNLLFANGNGGVLGNIGGTNQTNISTFGTGNLASDPNFVNHLGNAAVADLHIQTPPAGTPIESTGTPIAAVTIDFDSDERNSNTPVDIGADAGLFQAIDNVPPDIIYTAIPNGCNNVNNYQVTGIEITDSGSGSSVNTSAGLSPRLYYKKSGDANDLTGWKYVEATNTSSPFEFNIDYTLLNAGSININDEIQYFVVAQDEGPIVFSPNVALNSGTFASQPASVALTSAAFPIGGSINSFAILPCQGTITVGAGGTYPALTTSDGVFQAINNANLTGNIIIEIVSDIDIEDGTHGLNEFAAPHTLEIRSDGNPWTLSGSFGAAPNGLFRLNGADRVTVNGGTANQRLLTFRNTNTSNNNATWHIYNDAQDLQFNNLILEGGASSTLASGVVRIGAGAMSGNGNDNITIERCDIRDLTTATSYPRNGIYAAGTSSVIANDNINIEDCNIFNFYAAGQQSSGVRIETFNADWTIKNNDFYQTVTHNATASTEQYVIYVNTTSGQISVDGNRIGGSAANLSGNWEISPAPTSPSTYRFVGIWQNAAPTIGHQIINNQIGRMVMQTSSGANTNYGVFSGIYVAAGSSTITGNTIGADDVDASTAAGANIDFGSSSNGAVLYGIRNIGTGTLLIDDNKIGGIRFSNATGAGVNTGGALHGISSTSGAVTITNNTIGSTTTANNLVINGLNASTNPVNLYGIEITSSGANVNNNIIRNLTNGGLTSSGNTHGIRVTGAGAQNVNNNEISLLRGAGTQSSYGTSAAVAGIVLSNSSTTASSVSNNTIFNLTQNAGVANSAKIIGISFDAGNNANHAVNANTIYGFNSLQNSPGIEHVGIEIGSAAGAMRASNNMIRLGRIADGSEFTNSSSIVGILDQSNAAQNIWFNTVLIDGTAETGSAANSYAYRRTVNVGADNIRNNILANNRSGGPSGSIHFAWASNTLGGLTAAAFDNNIFFSANNTEFSITATPSNISANSNPALRLQALRGNAGAFGNNLRSGIASMSQINFVDPTGATPNLRLNNANAAAGAGVSIPAITSDFDGTITRANPPAIGAHESSSFNAIATGYDIYTPLVSVSSVPTLTAACGGEQTVLINATVTDLGLGVATGSLQPTLWWRLSTGTYAPLLPTSQAGDTYTYELNLTEITSGQTYHYYVAAQDNESPSNIFYSNYNATTPVHSDVATMASPINGSPSTFSVSASNPLSGTVTVGSGGDFPSFNANPGGLFEAINTRGLSGDLEVLVISNINEQANWTPLYSHDEFCGSGYTITIKPNAATLYTIEANTSAANAMFSFFGARRVVIDGSFDGSGRFLRLRHNRVTSIFASTVEMNNGANNISISNCIIEGANTNLSSNTTGSVGVVRIGGSMGFANGNLNNIMIHGNEIRNLSNASPSLSNVPANLIYMGGASNSANINNITISENDMYNFQNSAVRADNGSSSMSNSIGNNINILNNNIYQELIIPTYQYPIVIDALGNTFGHVISGNKIGGSTKPNPEITGTWQNNKVDGELIAIYANVGNAPTQEEALSIQGNKIQRFNISGTGWTNFVGVRVQNGRVNIGNVDGNVIGSEDNSTDNIISNGSGGSFLSEDAAVIGIWTQSSEEVVIENNTISGLSTGLGTFCFMDGIAHGSNMTFNGISYTSPGGKSTIRNNTIANNRSSSNLQNSAVSNEGMISLFVYTNSMDNVIEGNLIQNNGLNAIANANVRNHGVLLGILGQPVNHGGVFRKNTIAALANTNTGTAPEINGLVLNHGNWEVSNNMISMRNGTTGSHIDFRNTFVIGIRDHLRNVAGQGANYIHNSVYIYGTNGGSGTGNPSYNYLRIPNNTGSVAGAPTTMRNNIFINERTGLGTHRALGNINTGSPSTGWNSSASDYNFIATQSAGTATRWGLTDYNLSGWQTQSGGDANSDYKPAAATTIANVQLKPTDLFESDFLFGNLRIASANVDAANFIAQKGTAVSVLTDIDNNPRNPTTPDIGAHEFTQLDADAGITEALATICEGNQDVDVTLHNYGAVVLTSVTVNWSINGNGQTPYNWSGSLAAGDSLVITIGSFNFSANVDYTLVSSTSNPNGGADANTANDSYTSEQFNSTPIPATPAAINGITQPCALVENQIYSIDLVSGATTYNWTVPTGWSITSGNGTDSILVNTGSVGQHGNIQVTAENACGISAPQSLAVTLPAANSVLSGDGDNRTCLVNKNGWIHFYDNDGDLIVSVNSLGQNLGSVTATSYLNASPYVTSACDDLNNPSFFQANLQRTFVIDAQNQPATPVKVRLYLLDAEVAAYQAAALATAQNTLDDIPNGLEDLNMTKVSNGAGTGNPTDFCGSGGAAEFLLQDASGNINLQTTGLTGFTATSFLEFTIDGFSEFFPMNSENSALPVTLTNFSANCANDKIQVNWTTASELNASHYILQSSRDGLIWIEEVQVSAAGTTNQSSTYSAQVQNFGSLTYYRLLQIDLNGDQEIFGPISSNCAMENNLMSVYPNPASENFTVYIQTSENFENATIELVDMSGRVILSQTTNINAGSTMLNFDVKAIQPGAYIIRVKGENDKFAPMRVVKM